MIATNTALMLGAAWVLIALAVGVAVGLGIRVADRRKPMSLDDVVNTLPVECLAPAEVTRRAERVWWA